MEVSAVSDDNIIDLKNFKKVNGEIINIKNKRKKNKKPVAEENLEDIEMPDDFDDEIQELLEENEALQLELMKERIRRQTIEKLLNKLLKQQMNRKDNDE